MKNKFRILTVAFLTYILISGSNAYSFTNSDYYNNLNISIGLESMESSQLNITLNGDYNLNGVVCKSGTSYVLKAIGTKIDLAGKLYDNVSFIANNSSNTINIGSSYSKNYLGTMNFNLDPSSGTSKIIPINNLYIEDYLKGVVGKEMSDSFPSEALKAQAVAARNYALANIGKHNAKGYSLCDTIHCQVYGGYDTSLKNVITAVDSTKGMLLLSGTSLVNAFYFASDGGYAEASENVWLQAVSYLKAKKDVYDGYDIDYLWKKTYTNDDINNLFKLNPKVQPTDTFVKIDMSTITKFDSGRIKNISLIFKNSLGTQYAISYNKEPARTFLNLKSALYNVSYNATNETYTFDGKGIGHGVGMSQIGAKNRATAGQSFNNILNFYYDGTTLVNTLPKITFNSQGGSAVTGKTADYDSVIIAPVAASTKTGYTFDGWYKEAGCLNTWNFTTDKVTIDTTLYAKWAIVVVPNSVTNAKATSSSYNSINVTWNAVIGANCYEVFRSTSSNGTYSIVARVITLNFNNGGLATGRVYYYKVRSYRTVGTAKVYCNYWSNISYVKVVPAAVVNVKAVRTSSKSIRITWNKVTGASGYEVFRSTTSNGTYSVVARTSYLYSYYNNSGLTTGRTYYCKVRSYRTVGTTKVYCNYWSNITYAKPY